jgi:hypothetical protein
VAALAAGHGEPAGRPSLVTERINPFDVDESALVLSSGGSGSFDANELALGTWPQTR